MPKSSYRYTSRYMHILPYYYSGDPSKVDLPGSAAQIACGDNHTVILLASGEIYTFGNHKVTQRCEQIYM